MPEIYVTIFDFYIFYDFTVDGEGGGGHANYYYQIS